MKPLRFIFFCVATSAALMLLGYLATRNPAPPGRLAPVTNGSVELNPLKNDDRQVFANAAQEQRIRVVLDNPFDLPLSSRKTLRAEDEPILLKEYLGKTNVTGTMSLTWALAFVGGDATVEAFKHTLTDKFQGTQLTGGNGNEDTDEASVMHSTVWALGLLAKRNDAAFAFLQRGTDPWFWQKNIKWKSSNNEGDYGSLAGRAIESIGISGRKDVPDILEALSKLPLVNEPDPSLIKGSFSGALLSAAFYYALIRDEGDEAFFQRFLHSSSDVFDADGKYRKWKATPEGIKWREWRDKFNKAETADMLKKLEQFQK